MVMNSRGKRQSYPLNEQSAKKAKIIGNAQRMLFFLFNMKNCENLLTKPLTMSRWTFKTCTLHALTEHTFYFPITIQHRDQVYGQQGRGVGEARCEYKQQLAWMIILDQKRIRIEEQFHHFYAKKSKKG